MNRLLVSESSQSSLVQNLLAALDVAFAVAPLEEIAAGETKSATALLLTESQFVELSDAARRSSTSARELLSRFKDVLVYPFHGTPEGLRALEHCVGGRASTVQLSARGTSDYVVASNRRICGPFAGLKVGSVRSENDVVLRVEGATYPPEFLVAHNDGGLLSKFTLPGLNLSVLSSADVFDVSAAHVRNLDVQSCFSGLVPLLFYLRDSQIERPMPTLRWANWIIDDPNLRPRYGFLDLKKLADCVRETGAAATIAFIPWNHKRTSRQIVDLFRANRPQLSICVHGCDHTGSEFSTRTSSDAMPLIDLAMKRMKQLEADTGLGCEKVMVFPQGRFSSEAMRALRHSEMVAAVNTELLDCQTGRGVSGAELLKPAITSFGGFPLFMRRPAEEPLGNFALDLILGKPCLIVTHHQYFQHGLNPLRSTVEALNAIEPELKWTNLEQGILSTYSISKSSDARVSIRLFSASTVWTPQTEETVTVSKAETDPAGLEVFVDDRRLPVSSANGDLQFSLNGAGKKAIRIDIRSAVPAAPQPEQSRKYRLKVTARRYLTEVRDNYLCRFPRLTAGAASLQQLLQKAR
jgi:hypothetical protein